ncbi:NADH-quinone oxidoreductase subunit L [Hyphomicrobium sp.]|uniref:NADH-quinone oxidoreductase subunit L n=1 Tax=Hyphomicrobium sp. TaxID=82 RepID=UPI000FAE2008|nr:NADH-quinone oxidoreductase subunit L [Hyphomicrobium sp.]RUO97796.1 MAG: NADH-quinone oxidoreductase subunit L [Hyphomicrobium sp.]
MIYAAIVFLPLAGALIAGFFGRIIGARPCEVITTSFLMIAAVLSWIVFFQVALGHETHEITLMRWITSGELDISWALKIDTLTSVMLVVVTTVSSLVHLYSIGYMHEDDSRPRFFAYLSLFTFAMLMLVTSNNLVQMFFGWEGVGLASYLLIGFWYTKPSACAAAIKAFVVNRVGDFGFALGIFGLFFVFHTVNFDALFAAVPGAVGKTFNFAGHDVDILTTISLLLFMGAMGKSAQFLLHTWLPDAMEGPTPVSALIHAATMVTAGVFMVARLSPIFELAPDALAFVTLIGAITAFFAATVGLVQNDIKRVIAYSTCSQLGYMFVACGIGAYGAGIFHLFTHAFFKALLFLGAGSVIHAMHHEQDMRHMGGLRPKIPWTFAAMLIGTLALTGVGIPHLTGFAGFYSKDAIIEASYAAATPNNYAFWLLVIAALMTSFYSWRLVFLTFYGKTRADHHTYDHAHESPPSMMIPLAVLSLGAVAAGIVFAPYFIGHDQKEFWGAAIFTGQNNHILHEMHDVPEWVSYSSFVAMLLGFAIAWVYYIGAPWLPEATARAFKPLYLFLLNKWYFDELYNFIFVRPAFAIGRLLWKGGDGAIIDGTIDGTAAGVVRVTDRVVKLQTGYMYHYAFAMLIGVAAILTWLTYNGLFGGVLK